MTIEGDASSASYFLAAAAISGGEVCVRGCGSSSLQGDVHFASEVLQQMGAQVALSAESVCVRGVDAQGNRLPLRGFRGDLRHMPDAAMTLAVAALFAQGPTTIEGISSWRVKETDRLAAMHAELGKLGAEVRVTEGSLHIVPPRRVRSGVSIATYDDHRMAMAFSLVAAGGVAVRIEDARCVQKTFPHYFEVFASLRRGTFQVQSGGDLPPGAADRSSRR